MSKILVIDDEETNVRVLSMSLRSDGHEVVAAYNGEQGIDVFKKESPDLVLTDIKMPGMDGIEVLQAIKGLESDAEVIIITGHGDIDNAIEALKFGASDFINKPIRDEVLAVAIRRAEEKRDIKLQLKAYTTNLECKVEQSEQDLQRQSNFLTKLIRSSNDGIIATDKDLTIVVYNPGAEHIFGYASDEVIHRRKITELLPADLAQLFEPSMWQSSDAGELVWQEATIRAKDQTSIPVSFYGTPLWENEGVIGSVSFFQDLREIKRLEAELVQAERLAAIGQTVAGVAHGVKNILHGFKGGSYLVDLGIAKGDTDQLKKGWELIQRNIGRTSDLVLDLLSYSKERSPEYEACEPNAILQDVCELMQAVADENHVLLTSQMDSAIKTVMMDPRTVHQCLTNLISNAIDACLFDEKTDKQWLVHVQTLLESDHHVRFTISDNGSGMDQAVQAKLFTSFFSTKGHRGTGLGLLVTRKLVQEHDGTIAVESAKGEGTTFIIRLPFATQ